jgi:hypothetical protein
VPFCGLVQVLPHIVSGQQISFFLQSKSNMQFLPGRTSLGQRLAILKVMIETKVKINRMYFMSNLIFFKALDEWINCHENLYMKTSCYSENCEENQFLIDKPENWKKYQKQFEMFTL